jgi:hypothetical protein
MLMTGLPFSWRASRRCDRPVNSARDREYTLMINIHEYKQFYLIHDKLYAVSRV